MLSRTLRVMFEAKTTIYYKLSIFLHIALFLVHFNSFEVICSQGL